MYANHDFVLSAPWDRSSTLRRIKKRMAAVLFAVTEGVGSGAGVGGSKPFVIGGDADE